MAVNRHWRIFLYLSLPRFLCKSFKIKDLLSYIYVIQNKTCAISIAYI